MPRLCVLCGKFQGHSFSVFSFPSSVRKRNDWLRVILEAKPEFIKDKKLVKNNRLKNGVCERHFLLSEISNGKKRRLDKDAVPSLSIPTSSKCNAIIRKYNVLLRSERENEESLEETFISKNTDIDILSNQIVGTYSCHDSSLPDCTIEIEHRNHSPKIYKCVVQDLNEENKGFCLCCGSQMDWNLLFSVAILKGSCVRQSMLEELSDVFDIPQERITKFSKSICQKCVKIVKDLLELRKSFHTLLAYLKRKLFSNINSGNFENEDKGLQIDDRETIPDGNRSPTLNRFIEEKSCSFPCIDCSEEFETLNGFCNHIAVHERDLYRSSEAKYNCSHCSQKFSTKSALHLHLKSHQQKYLCQNCGRRVVIKEKLALFNNKKKVDVKLLKCKSCERDASKTASTYKSVHDKTFACELCLKSFKSRILLQKHKVAVHAERKILCEKCGEKFITISKLNSHLNSVHHNNETWICNMCDEKFTALSVYKHHLALRHSCIQCGLLSKKLINSFSWKSVDDVCPKCTCKDNSSLFQNDKSIPHTGSSKHSEESNVSSKSDRSAVEHRVYISGKRVDESSHVLQDILRASNEYENSNLRTVDFPLERLKVERDDAEISNADILSFDNVGTLGDQSVAHDPIELGKDISLINAHMLEDIQHSNVETIKKEAVEVDHQDTLNIIDSLVSDIETSSAVQSPSLHSEQTKCDVELKEVDVMHSISSPGTISQEITSNHGVQLIESLVSPHLEQSNLQDMPVSLQPVKNNWAFTNSVEHSDSSVNHVIHSFSVARAVHEDNPPVTREIDITVPSDDEDTNHDPLSDPLNDTGNKLDDHGLSSFSLNIDGKGDVHYVMYFEPPIDKG